ncbi:MAG: hypothetical protein ACHP9Z_23105, partial [Streptosporangiales bacterium]
VSMIRSGSYIRVSVAALAWTSGHAGLMDLRTVGVEEELLLVEPATGRPRAVAGAVLRAAEQEPGPAASRWPPWPPRRWRSSRG